MTFSMSRGTAARLKEIATVENTSLQQLVAVAVDEWLGRRSDVSHTKAANPPAADHDLENQAMYLRTARVSASTYPRWVSGDASAAQDAFRKSQRDRPSSVGR
jgi:hypothetical protein